MKQTPKSDIRAFLLEKGIPPENKGFRCAAIALDLIFEDSEILHNITRRLYPAVVRRVSSASSEVNVLGVERAIRYGICCSKTPTLSNSRFLATCYYELGGK